MGFSEQLKNARKKAKYKNIIDCYSRVDGARQAALEEQAEFGVAKWRQ